MNASLSLKDRILSAAAAQPSLTRPQARRLALGISLGSIVLSALVFELAGTATRSVLQRETFRLVDASMLVSATLSAVLLGRGPMAMAKAGPLLRHLALLAAVSTVFWTRERALYCGGGSTMGAWTTLCIVLIIAAPPIMAHRSMNAGSRPQHARRLGAAAGTVAASWAALVSLLLGARAGQVSSPIGVISLSAVCVLGGAATGRTLLRSRNGPSARTGIAGGAP